MSVLYIYYTIQKTITSSKCNMSKVLKRTKLITQLLFVELSVKLIDEILNARIIFNIQWQLSLSCTKYRHMGIMYLIQY